MRRGDGLCYWALGVLLILLAFPSAGQAQTCTGGIVSPPADGRVLGPYALGDTGTPTSYQVLVGVENGRSYVFDSFNNTGGGWAQININTATCPGTDLTTGATIRDITTVSPPIITSWGMRKSLRVTSAITSVWARLWNSYGAGAATSGSFSVTETTMFSSAWSTNGTYDTFYSFQNTTNATCNVTLTLLDTAGTVRTTFSSAVATGATLSTNTSALGTARTLTGTARLTHDCPPNTINGAAFIANFNITPTPYIQFVGFFQRETR
jgi:hypothetical protein